jgi:ribose/xylose/arabinose/galactoside ABC-type transport system permease subunit
VNTTSSPPKAGVILSRFGFPIVLVGIFVAFSVTANGFLTIGSLNDMAHDMAPLVVISAAEAFVVMSGKLDISVGSIAFLSASLVSLAMRAFDIDPLAALLIALVAGGLMGAVNGAIVVALRVNALIATLGTMIMFRGIGLELTDAGLVPLPERVRLLGNLSVGPLFVDVVVAATVLFALHVLISAPDLDARSWRSETARLSPPTWAFQFGRSSFAASFSAACLLLLAAY